MPAGDAPRWLPRRIPPPYGVAVGLAAMDADTCAVGDAVSDGDDAADADGLADALGTEVPLGSGMGLGDGKIVLGIFAKERAKMSRKMTTTPITHARASRSVWGGRAPR